MCGDCCEKNSLSRMGYVDPVLICSKCLPIVRSEEEFLTSQVQHLVHGEVMASRCNVYSQEFIVHSINIGQKWIFYLSGTIEDFLVTRKYSCWFSLVCSTLHEHCLV